MVVKAKTDQHKIWIARTGETDIGGSRTISETPHTGLLFKAANTSAWAISPAEDLKFSIKIDNFTTDTDGVLHLQMMMFQQKLYPKTHLLLLMQVLR